MRAYFKFFLFLILLSLFLLIDSLFISNESQIPRQEESVGQQTKFIVDKPVFYEDESSDINLDPNWEVSISEYPELNDILFSIDDPTGLMEVQKNPTESSFSVIDTIEELGVMRLRVNDPIRFAEILSDIEGTFKLERNVRLSTPALPEARILEAEVPFSFNSMTWLGVSEDRQSRGQGVKVAILDTGVDISHPSLDGLAIRQVSLLQSNSNRALGHGTGIASIIAGQSSSLLGLAPSSEILSVQVLDENGQGDAFTIAKGILMAVDEGSQVINLSLGGMTSSPVLDHAIQVANSKGVILVSAVGNDGAPKIAYPARHKDVVAVSSVDAKSRVSTFSNYGEEVDIAAPGVGVITAWEDDEYVNFSGTSIAAAFVTGTIASEISRSQSYTPTGLLSSLYENADETEKPGFDQWSGNGVLNIRRLEQRDTPGIVDAAIVGYYFDSKNLSSSGTKPFSVTVQNQGTSWIQSMELKIKYKGLEKIFMIGNLAKGEIQSEKLYFDAGNRQGELAIYSEVTLNNQKDQNPENNKRTSVLVLP